MYRRQISDARIIVYAETQRTTQLIIDEIRTIFPNASNSPIKQTQQGDYHSILNVSLQEP